MRRLASSFLIALLAACSAEADPEPSESVPHAGAWDDEPDAAAPHEPAQCPRTRTLSGSIEGVSIDSPDYTMDVTWYNDSLEQELSDFERDIVMDAGLDPDDPEDVARYRYFSAAFDLRVLLREESGDLAHFEVKRDLGLYLFDLEASDAQPRQAVAIYDASPIEAARDHGTKAELGEALRTVIDDMRGNGQADAILAFEPDRSDEGVRVVLINLFGKDTRFASTGTASFDELYDDAEAVTAIEHPLEAADHVSIHAQASVGSDAVAVEVLCADLGVVN
jgi:hypothetical protein